MDERITSAQRDSVVDLMNVLPFVRWDRYAFQPEAEMLTIFGWIDRTDGHADYVQAMSWPDGKGGYVRWSMTSSAERSREIQSLVDGSDDGHEDCRRVEHGFAGLVEHVIHLDHEAS